MEEIIELIKKAITHGFGWYDWNHYYKLDYRCVSVLITEVKGEK